MSPSDLDLSLINHFIRVWDESDARRAAKIVEHGSLNAHVKSMEVGLRQRPVRSSVLIGDHGAGKTATMLALGRRLRSRGWVVFEATASDLMSSQMFIGQLDGRILALSETTQLEPTLLWYCPSFQELLFAGQHIQSPVGLLQILLPHLEAGYVRMVGECTPAGWETALSTLPQLSTVMNPVRLEPLSTDESIELGLDWAEKTKARGLDRALISEAANLVDQFPGGQQQPGRLLGLLDAVRKEVSARDSSKEPVTQRDMVTVLSSRSGIPTQLLDDREGLDMQEVTEFLERYVLGQQEAVAALVERIALIKAGLTDPTRPQGVFLFVGPTGTGKTELAKALARYLFGSEERLIRLDMTEFQDQSSLDRLLGGSGALQDPSSLVSKVRQQPFSVVLLDEFEKAHSGIGDLFLQLFDDGRLTGRDGETSDFRSAIVILTSNLGARGVGRPNLGFSGGVQTVTDGTIQRALDSLFRPEFLNRIDRILPFRPLSRPVMRKVLDIEIQRVFTRRGLRRRGWAVEWEEAALDFLLDRGFSESLGARPLKRAVERLFLTPLAAAIVQRDVPEGEQFLFVRRAQDGLAVDFVDPDASEEGEVLESPLEEGSELVLEGIAFSGNGNPKELEALRIEFDRLNEIRTAPSWEERKDRGLTTMATEGFWDSDMRHKVLGEVEYMDRIEVGLETADSLLRRLQKGNWTRAPARLVRRLAEQLYLVGEALEELSDGLLGEAFLMVREARDPGSSSAVGAEFAQELFLMYAKWAERRRMKHRVLQDGALQAGPYTGVLAVSGFGALRILSGESGHHVLEVPRSKGEAERARVVVTVVAQPQKPLPSDPAEAKKAALKSLATSKGGSEAPVVRRYRKGPAPLVRDAVQGWRTGNLDRVLVGDFDLVT